MTASLVKKSAPAAKDPAKTSSRPRRGTITKPLIMQVSAAMFQEKGYDRSSLEDIAKVLKIAKPSLYYHFKSKEDILLECIRAGYEHFQDELSNKDSLTLPGRERVRIFLELYSYIISNDVGLSMIMADDRVMSSTAKKTYNKYRKVMNTQLEERITAGIEDHSIKAPESIITTYAIFAMFNGIASMPFERHGISIQAAMKRFFSIMFDGISAD